MAYTITSQPLKSDYSSTEPNENLELTEECLDKHQLNKSSSSDEEHDENPTDCCCYFNPEGPYRHLNYLTFCCRCCGKCIDESFESCANSITRCCEKDNEK